MQIEKDRKKDKEKKNMFERWKGSGGLDITGSSPVIGLP